MDLLLLLRVMRWLHILLDVRVDVEQRASDDVYNDVGLSYIDKHVVFKHDWFFLSDEHSIANAEVFDEVVVRVQVKLNLEVSAPMLFGCLLVLVWNHKVIYDALNSRLLVVEASLVLLDALLAAEENKTVTHVQTFIIFISVLLNRLIYTLIETVLVTAVVSI